MSQLLIRQRVFSWTDSYDVYDASGNPKYFVKADLLSIGHRIRVYDKASGREIGLIQEKVLRILAEFEVRIGGQYQGIIKKQLTFFRPKFNIDYKGWRLEGDIMQWNYLIYEGSRLVVQMTKKLFQWGDTYVLDIANDSDEIPALMVAIAIDAARCSDSDQQHSLF